MALFTINRGVAKLILPFVVLAPLFIFFAAQAHPSVSAEPEDGMGGRESAVVSVSAAVEDLPEPEEFSKPRMLLYSSYTVKKGDVLSDIARQFGLNSGTLVSLNNIKNARNIAIDLTLKIPNQDGISYKVKKGDTLESIAKANKIEVEPIKVANELFSSNITLNSTLFLPGAEMPKVEEQQIYGDLFIWPVRGRLTSYYGYRRSPFTGGRSFHAGLDIAAPNGYPIKAAMAGRVQSMGWDNTYGNFVVISHQGGYRTLYGHMSRTATQSGAYVNVDDVIGYVGSTGQSTGPHLHFTVYKNGATVNPRPLLMR
ncbi:MAG: M23 family metallopeptidase [Treponema sp.]|jgi:murein DD-endopeptidase MepM/ murein hydrolase activator NlpD|nr:M23 family metallopeptidase [Treponema sp.]